MKRLTYALFLTIMLFGYNAYGQGVPCFPEYTGFYQTFQIPKTYPQFYTDMPYNVMIAYIALDSLAKNGDYERTKEFINRQTYSDTLKYLRKYLYEVIDYDPLLFNYYKLFWYPRKDIKLEHSFVVDKIISQIYLTPYSVLKNDEYFFDADIITHIKALGQQKLINKSSMIYPTEISICSQVLDKIKGQRLNSNFYCLPQYKSNEKLPSFERTEFLQFVYLLEGKLTNMGMHCSDMDIRVIEDTSNIVNYKYGENYFKQSEEYIIFAKIDHICQNNSIGYFSYGLNFGVDYNMLVFPIKNGIVIDEYDSFGFGKNLPVDTFKAKLRERIQQIKDMRY